jgi:hypothetical protein
LENTTGEISPNYIYIKREREREREVKFTSRGKNSIRQKIRVEDRVALLEKFTNINILKKKKKGVFI